MIYWNVSVIRPPSVTNNNTSNKTCILGATITKLTLNIQRLHNKLNRIQRIIYSEQRVRGALKYKIHRIEIKLKILLNEGYVTYSSLNQKILMS